MEEETIECKECGQVYNRYAAFRIRKEGERFWALCICGSKLEEVALVWKKEQEVMSPEIKYWWRVGG